MRPFQRNTNIIYRSSHGCLARECFYRVVAPFKITGLPDKFQTPERIRHPRTHPNLKIKDRDEN
jgi:hypothetical protein